MKILSPSCWLPAAPAAAALLGISSCSEETASGDAAAEEPDRQGATEFFRPQSGELWKYKVQREVPVEVKLSEADQARRPQRTESGHLITFERVRTCTGTRRAPGADEVLTIMRIEENGVRLGEEFYDINAEGVFSRGWIAAGADETGDGTLLDEGVALATTKMQPGQIWQGVGLDSRRQFLFRVIEFSRVKVPAGTFDTARIQITSELDGKSLKRTVWFAANVGIVKEESVYYGPQRTRVREQAELIHWVVPSNQLPAEKSLINTGGEDAQPEEEDAPVEDEPTEEGEPEDGEEPVEEGEDEDEGEGEDESNEENEDT